MKAGQITLDGNGRFSPVADFKLGNNAIDVTAHQELADIGARPMSLL
jgi:hypothetical protein